MNHLAAIKTVSEAMGGMIEHVSHRMGWEYDHESILSRRQAIARVAEAVQKAITERRYLEVKRILADYYIEDGCLEAGVWSLEELFYEFSADHNIHHGRYIELSDEDKEDLGLSVEEDAEDFDPYADYVRSEVSFLKNCYRRGA